MTLCNACICAVPSGSGVQEGMTGELLPWGRAMLVLSMDPNQGTGYGARVAHVLPNGHVRMVQSDVRPPWRWPALRPSRPNTRAPRMRVVMFHGNHRFRGLLRQIVHHGCVLGMMDAAGTSVTRWNLLFFRS